MSVRLTKAYSLKVGAILALLVAGSVYFFVTIVTIRNESAVPMTDMTCTISGRAFCPSAVGPGETRRAFAVLSSEDALYFSFRIQGNQEQAIIGYPIPIPARGYGIIVGPDMTLAQETYYRW